MNIRLLLSFLLFLFLFPQISDAQKIRSETITYHYHRLPSQPIDKKYRTYQLKIEAPYEEKNKQLIKDYENKNQRRGSSM